jgi:23S rRNA pseudouridine2605 synthase
MSDKKIQLIIRDAGVASRRSAETLIREGRVTLNGQVVLDPAIFADPDRDHIKVDGKLIPRPETTKYCYLFNKPRHVVSTMADPQGRPCVGDLIKPLKKRLFSVGRLDFDAEGLMILTNDGILAQKLSHPSNKVPRTYMVKVRGAPPDDELGKIRKGMSIGEGERVGNVSWTVVRKQTTTTWIKIVLYEGRKNEIKRIFFRIGHPVRKIRRISYGPFSLGTIPTGSLRPLSEAETEKLEALLHPPGSPSSRRDAPKNRQE